MKNRLYKTLLLLLVFSLLAACGSSDDAKLLQNDIMLDSNSFENNVNIRLTLPSNGHIRSEEYFSEWQEYLNEHFDVNITINFTLNNETDYVAKYSLEYLSKKQQGLFFVEAHEFNEFMGYAMQYNLITDITDILKSNKVWAELPEAYNRLYTEGGKVFGIPNTITPKIYGRLLNRQWMNNLGLKEPENLTELANVLNMFANNDPDLSGENDTVGIAYSSAFDFIDIFSAYGCYLDFTYARNSSVRYLSSITFNPISERYEDSMLKPEMKDVFLYIEGLLEYGTCVPLTENINAGSYYGYYDKDDSSYIFNYLMKGEQDNKVIPLSYIEEKTGAYFVSARTEDAESVVDSFINIFYGSKDGNYIGANGITTDVNDLLIPYVCEDIFTIKSKDMLAEIEKANNYYYVLPENYISLTPSNFTGTGGRNSRTNSYYTIFNNTFNSFLSERLNIDDYISNYTTQVKKIGIDNLLIELNND